MRKSFFIFLLFLLPQVTHAETIELSDGSIIQAKIIERTDHDITVNADGMRVTYFLAEVISIDRDLDEDIARLLESRGYPQAAWGPITRELKEFLIKIDFPALKNEAPQVQKDPEEFKAYLAKLGRLMKAQGCLNFQYPHPLIKLLVNGLSGEDIFPIIDSSSFACSAISQLASIILELLGIDARLAIAPEHVFNVVLLDQGQVLFADFSNEVFEELDLRKYYRPSGRYQVLKEEQRLSSGQVLDINKKWNEGVMPMTLKGILNLGLYFYMAITDNLSATAVLYSNRGNDEMSKGAFDKAMADYSLALAINPHISGIYCNRGLAFAKEGHLIQAIADYNRALEINPNDASAYNDRGLAYKNNGDMPQAIADFHKAIEINPNLAQIYNNLGNALAQEGHLAQSIWCYKKAIEIAPDDPAAWEDLRRLENLSNSK